MTSENTPYVDYLHNEHYLRTLKEKWEGRFGEKTKGINYPFIAYIYPEEGKPDETREFYVKFTLSYGRVNSEVVFDQTPKKPKIGWMWKGVPAQWKQAYETGQLSALKKSVKIFQFQKINMDSITSVMALFFGAVFSIARDFGFIDGESKVGINTEVLTDANKAVERATTDILFDFDRQYQKNQEIALLELDKFIEYCNSILESGDSMEYFRRMTMPDDFFMTLIKLTWKTNEVHDYVNSLRIFEIMFNQHKKMGDSKQIPYDLHEMGKILALKGDTDSALKSLHEALELYENMKNYTGITHVLTSIAQLYDMVLEFDKARDYFLKSAKTAKHTKDKWTIKYNRSRFKIFEGKERLWNVFLKWKSELNLKEKNLYIRRSKEFDFVKFPLKPTPEDYRFLYNQIFSLYIAKQGQIRYYFEGIDESGNKIIDDNAGKFYKGFP